MPVYGYPLPSITNFPFPLNFLVISTAFVLHSNVSNKGKQKSLTHNRRATGLAWHAKACFHFQV